MVFTDPPYNVPIAGHVCGPGEVQHREFAMASGEMSEQAFTDFLTTVLGHLARHSVDGAIHFVCMDWRHMGELLAAGRASTANSRTSSCGTRPMPAWAASTAPSTSWCLSSRSAPRAHMNNFELGQHGRYRTNVWDYPGINTFRPDRMEELRMHPTVKPVALVADAIRDCSHRGEARARRILRAARGPAAR